MTHRKLTLVACLLLALGGAWYFWPQATTVPAVSGNKTPTAGIPVSPARHAGESPPASAARPSAPFDPADFPIAAALNAPASTIGRDLDTLQQLFVAWRTNFPHEGNPIGENADITAALTGANRLGLTLAPKSHPAINGRGELCDRWGTPFRFHQLSGERMEIRSAGPDRKFATDDDAVWTPP
jgi:hypothetical protein